MDKTMLNRCADGKKDRNESKKAVAIDSVALFYHTVKGTAAEEVIRQFIFKITKSHTHGQYTGANSAIIRGLVTQYGALYGVNDKPNKAFSATDLDICFISSQCI